MIRTPLALLLILTTPGLAFAPVPPYRVIGVWKVAVPAPKLAATKIRTPGSGRRFSPVHLPDVSSVGELAGLPLPQSQAPQPTPAPPLTEDERREVLSRLHELKLTRSEVLLYQNALAQSEANAKKADEACARQLELEKRATALMEKEKVIAEQAATRYEEMFKLASKRKGIGTRLKSGVLWVGVIGAGIGAAILMNR